MLWKVKVINEGSRHKLNEAGCLSMRILRVRSGGAADAKVHPAGRTAAPALEDCPRGGAVDFLTGFG